MQLKLHKKCINYLGPTDTTTAAFSCADVKICALFTQSEVKQSLLPCYCKCRLQTDTNWLPILATTLWNDPFWYGKRLTKIALPKVSGHGWYCCNNRTSPEKYAGAGWRAKKLPNKFVALNSKCKLQNRRLSKILLHTNGAEQCWKLTEKTKKPTLLRGRKWFVFTLLR